MVPKLKEMVPSLGTELSNEPALFEEVWSWGTKVLKLDEPADPTAPRRRIRRRSVRVTVADQ